MIREGPVTYNLTLCLEMSNSLRMLFYTNSLKHDIQTFFTIVFLGKKLDVSSRIIRLTMVKSYIALVYIEIVKGNPPAADDVPGGL